MTNGMETADTTLATEEVDSLRAAEEAKLAKYDVPKLNDANIVSTGHPPDDTVGGHPAQFVEGANLIELGSFIGGTYDKGGFSKQYVADTGPALELGKAFHQVADAKILPDAQPTADVTTPSSIPTPNMPWET